MAKKEKQPRITGATVSKFTEILIKVLADQQQRQSTTK